MDVGGGGGGREGRTYARKHAPPLGAFSVDGLSSNLSVRRCAASGNARSRMMSVCKSTYLRHPVRSQTTRQHDSVSLAPSSGDISCKCQTAWKTLASSQDLPVDNSLKVLMLRCLNVFTLRYHPPDEPPTRALDKEVANNIDLHSPCRSSTVLSSEKKSQHWCCRT